MIPNKFLSFATRSQNKDALILWVIFFCYAVCASLVFQKLLLPHLASIQTGSGLITNDAMYFDTVATSLANEIKTHGWSSWRLYPANSASGNVAILGALYALFGYDPSLAIPINAAIHAFGGVLIFLLACELASKESIGRYAGVIAGSLFVIYPSALVWYGQNHKDGYAIAGMLLTLFIWVKAIKNPDNRLSWVWLAVGNFIAIALVGSVRPFLLQLLLIAALGILLVLIISVVLRWKSSTKKWMIGYFLVVLIMLFSAIKTTTALGGLQSDTSYENWQGETYQQNIAEQRWQWKNSVWLPDSIESYIQTAAKTCAGLIAYGVSVKAKSTIDKDIAPQSVGEVLTYLPRALQVALFAPFPLSWLENISAVRLVATVETFIYYLSIPGVCMLLFYNRKPSVLLVAYFALFFLLIYGFTQANLGTLYRYRYGYFFIMLMLGVLGWLTWLDKTGRLKRLLNIFQPAAKLELPEKFILIDRQSERKEAIGSGFVVMGLTLLCFIGFFLRDIMMAKTFGLGATLDNFYIALLIPMFLVTALCMPLGTAFIPFYLGIKERTSHTRTNSLVAGVSFWITLSLFVICLILYIIGPTILPYFYFAESYPNMSQLIPLYELSLPILLFSGVIILGNSILNANGRTALSSSAQLVVPIISIFALLFFGSKYGVKAVMYGMVVGQLLNLLIVHYCLRHNNTSLFPQLTSHRHPEIYSLFLQYLPLVASAFFVAVAAPMATLLAISLPEGGVAAFNLGNKVTLFVTGLVGTAMTAVILPYFSALVSRNNLISARRELSFFLLLTTFISVPVSVCLYYWSELIVRLVFEGGEFNNTATELVTRVMQYAVIQLPFFVCNSLLVKFAVSTKHVIAVSGVAAIGLLTNICASIFFINHMGVAGIALGASLSMLLASVLLLLILVRYWHISRFDALVILLNWLLFVTLLLCLHFQSFSSAYMIVFAFSVLLTAYFSSLKADNFSPT